MGPRPTATRRRARGGDGERDGNGAGEHADEDAGEDEDEDEDGGGGGADPHTGGREAGARELGPWASAAQLDRGRGRAALRRAAKLREAAVEGTKAAREAALLWRPLRGGDAWGPSVGGVAVAGADAPSQQQHRQQQRGPLPKGPVAMPARAVPRLSALALRVIADRIDDVESLWGLPCELRNSIARELARRRALTEAAAFLLARDGPRELVLPDCTQADARAASRLAREAAASGALERLDLGLCGRGFGDEAVAGGFARAGGGSLPRLVDVRLSGAYRLSDAGVVALLEAAFSGAGAGGGGGGGAEERAGGAASGRGADAAAALARDQDGDGGGGGLGAGAGYDYEGGAAFAAALAGDDDAAAAAGGGGDGPEDEGGGGGGGGGLRSLGLPQCPRLEGPFLRRLPDLAPRLRALDLTDCRGLSASALRHALSRLPHLAALSLDGVPSAGEALLIEAVAGGAAARAGRLRELSLRGCAQGCTDAALSALASCASAPALEALRLDECHAFSDAALRALAEGCGALRELSLRRCSPALTDVALAALVSRGGGGMLRRVNVAGLSGAGPLLAAALARAGAGTLEALDVSFCRAMPEEGLGLIADSCPRLAELRVFGCSQITRKLLHGHGNARLASGEGLEEGGGGGGGRGLGGSHDGGGVVGVGTFVVA